MSAKTNDHNEELQLELERAAAFRGALRSFLQRTNDVSARAGLTAQRYDLLLMIRSSPYGELQIGELCEVLKLRQSAVTELVKRTEEAGLVERWSASDDKRVSLVRLTTEGERRFMQAFDDLRADRAALAAAFDELRRRFSAAARAGRAVRRVRHSSPSAKE